MCELIHLGQPTLRKTHVDRLSCHLGDPAQFTAFFNDDFDHVRAKNTGALGDDHLAMRVFVEFNADFDELIGATFAPTILNIVETDHFAFFEWEGHAWILNSKLQTPISKYQMGEREKKFVRDYVNR
jgi:hypothetical protein